MCLEAFLVNIYANQFIITITIIIIIIIENILKKYIINLYLLYR